MMQFVLLLLSSVTAQQLETEVQQGLPDFQPDSTYLQQTLSIDYVNATMDQCLIAERCLTGKGQRKILRFGTMVHNRGTADAILGQPPHAVDEGTNPPYWYFSASSQQ